MDIKDIIKNKRLEKGYTMKELADKIGVSEATISRWESGEISNMKHKGIIALSNILNIEPNSLMGWDEESPKHSEKEEFNIEDLPEFFETATEAKDFVFNKTRVFGFNGLDVTKLSDDELLMYANSILNTIKMLSRRLNK